MILHSKPLRLQRYKKTFESANLFSKKTMKSLFLKKKQLS